jgi:hypothetical protein
MSFEVLYLQLWVKHQTDVHIYVLLEWVRIVLSLM